MQANTSNSAILHTLTRNLIKLKHKGESIMNILIILIVGLGVIPIAAYNQFKKNEKTKKYASLYTALIFTFMLCTGTFFCCRENNINCVQPTSWSKTSSYNLVKQTDGTYVTELGSTYSYYLDTKDGILKKSGGGVFAIFDTEVTKDTMLYERGEPKTFIRYDNQTVPHVETYEGTYDFFANMFKFSNNATIKQIIVIPKNGINLDQKQATIKK